MAMMNFLPVVARELRVSARRPATYRARVWSAAAAISLSLSLAYVGFVQLGTPAQIGKYLLALLAALGFLYAQVAGVWLTADCLSREKREDTIGFLFLTDLSGLDIVIGKLVARSLRPLYSLLATFPAPVFGLFLGGITLADCLRPMLVVVDTLFFSLAAGLLISSLTRNERAAFSGAVLLVLYFDLVGPALAAWAAVRGGPAGSAATAEFLGGLGCSLSPLFLLIAALDPLLGGSAPPAMGEYFWGFFWSVHGMAWAMLIAAGACLPRAWRLHETRGRSGRLRQWLELLTQDVRDAFRGDAQRRRPITSDPALWLAERRQPMSLFALAGLAMVGLAAFVACALIPPPRPAETVTRILIPALWLLHQLLKYEVALHAARPLAEDKRSGALELLLTTPLAEAQIVRGCMLGLKRRFLAPFLVLVVADVLTWIYDWIGTLNSAEAGAAGLVLAGFIIVQLIDLYVLGWWALWQGLSTGNARRALHSAMVTVLAKPWICALFAAGPVVMLTRGALFRGPWADLANPLILVSAFVCVLTGSCARAMGGLQDEFRSKVAEAFTLKPTTPRWFSRELFRRG
jgi:hypothetical protein